MSWPAACLLPTACWPPVAHGLPQRMQPCAPLCVSAGAEELRLHEETRKQNDMLEQIHDGLGELMQGARVSPLLMCCRCPCRSHGCRQCCAGKAYQGVVRARTPHMHACMHVRAHVRSTCLHLMCACVRSVCESVHAQLCVCACSERAGVSLCLKM